MKASYKSKKSIVEVEETSVTIKMSQDEAV